MWTSTFDLDFDVDDEPTRPTPPPARARVLIVEQYSRLRTLVSTRLERDGYDVYTASSGSEAMTMLRFVENNGWPTDDFELVILDDCVEEPSGLEVLRRLREGHDTPALIMMAPVPAPWVDEACDFGAIRIVKPFSLDALCDATIDAMMNLRGKVRR